MDITEKLKAIGSLKTTQIEIPGSDGITLTLRELTTTERMMQGELDKKLGKDMTARYASLVIMACDELSEDHTETVCKWPPEFLANAAAKVFELCGVLDTQKSDLKKS